MRPAAGRARMLSPVDPLSCWLRGAEPPGPPRCGGFLLGGGTPAPDAPPAPDPPAPDTPAPDTPPAPDPPGRSRYGGRPRRGAWATDMGAGSGRGARLRICRRRLQIRPLQIRRPLQIGPLQIRRPLQMCPLQIRRPLQIRGRSRCAPATPDGPSAQIRGRPRRGAWARIWAPVRDAASGCRYGVRDVGQVDTAPVQVRGQQGAGVSISRQRGTVRWLLRVRVMRVGRVPG
jgi:hypothetical protein